MTSRGPAAALLRLFSDYLGSLGASRVDEFRVAIEAQMPERDLRPNGLACLRHLDRAAEIAGPPGKPLLAFLARHREALCWGQTYTAADFGERFLANYGWVELIGTRGYFASEAVAAGFLVLGPDILYPDHRHLAEELYVPLTGGTDWRQDGSGFAPRAAGEVIHHPSNVAHAMRTGAEPLVAIYLWRGGPLAQKSEFTAGRG